MNKVTPAEFLKRYTAWMAEAEAQMKAQGLKEGAQGRTWTFGESGTAYGKVFDKKGNEIRFQRTVLKNTVTPWEESKHFCQV